MLNFVVNTVPADSRAPTDTADDLFRSRISWRVTFQCGVPNQGTHRYVCNIRPQYYVSGQYWNREYHYGCHNRTTGLTPFYPLYLHLVTSTHFKIRHPWVSFPGAQSSNESEYLTTWQVTMIVTPAIGSGWHALLEHTQMSPNWYHPMSRQIYYPSCPH